MGNMCEPLQTSRSGHSLGTNRIQLTFSLALSRFSLLLPAFPGLSMAPVDLRWPSLMLQLPSCLIGNFRESKWCWPFMLPSC